MLNYTITLMLHACMIDVCVMTIIIIMKSNFWVIITKYCNEGGSYINIESSLFAIYLYVYV